MSLFGALSASVTALSAQSAAVNAASNNIANVSTNGYKATSVSFSTLVTGKIGGGVLESFRSDVDSQGSIQSTATGTDLAIQGQGFFTVENAAGGILYTRSGSFRADATGNLINDAGYKLLGWPLSPEGLLPGESGNLTNTTSNQDLDSLEVVSTSSISGTASPTSAITARINLKAEEQVLEGAGLTIDLVSSANQNNSSTDIIIPQGFVNGDTISITPGSNGTATNFEYGGISISEAVADIGDGSAANENSILSGTNFTDNAAFTIKSGSMTSAVTYTYLSTGANASLNQYSTLAELADIIDSTDGLTARVVSGVLYVAADDANDSITFADVSSSGLVSDFGFDQITADSDNNRFATLGNLATLVNSGSSSSGLAATLNNPSGSATLKIYNIDPTETITYTDTIATSDTNQLLTEFGFSVASNEASATPVYQAIANTGNNMASGVIAPDFSRTVTIYTPLGEGLDLRLAFVRIEDSTDGQKWAVELYAADPADVDANATVSTDKDDGLVSYGTISFDGDGTLSAIEGPISGNINVRAAGGANAQTVTLNLGTLGSTDGVSQFAGQYTVDELSQNGFPTGQLQSLEIDAEGYVTAIFDNSLTSQVYKLPLAYFSNPNGLTAESGNAYSSNTLAGEVTLGQVGDASVGTIVPSALESSTTELGTELTKLVIENQAYSAAANVIRKLTQLFETLQQL